MDTNVQLVQSHASVELPHEAGPLSRSARVVRKAGHQKEIKRKNDEAMW
jgi:hypothetical protein